MLISPGRWPGDGVALCLYSGMGTHGECGSPLPRPSWTTRVLGAKQTLRRWRMSDLSGPDVPWPGTTFFCGVLRPGPWAVVPSHLHRKLSTLHTWCDRWRLVCPPWEPCPWVAPTESGCCCRASGGLQRLPSWWFWLGRRTHVPRRAGWRALSGGSVEGPVGQWGVSRGRRCPSWFWYNLTLTRLSSSVQALVVWPLRWSK